MNNIWDVQRIGKPSSIHHRGGIEMPKNVTVCVPLDPELLRIVDTYRARVKIRAERPITRSTAIQALICRVDDLEQLVNVKPGRATHR